MIFPVEFTNKGLAPLGGDEIVSQLCEHVKQEHFDSDESVAVSNKGLAPLGVSQEK